MSIIYFPEFYPTPVICELCTATKDYEEVWSSPTQGKWVVRVLYKAQHPLKGHEKGWKCERNCLYDRKRYPQNDYFA